MAQAAERRAGRRRAPRAPVAPNPVERSGAPLYRRVLQALKDELLAGTYPVGTRLPTEGELSARFSVSRHTVREALRRLREDNLVTSRQGAGTTVCRFAVPQPYVHEVASIDDLVAYAAGTRYRADSSAMVTIDGDLAKRVGAALGERWLRIEGYRYAPGEAVPICWTEVFVQASYAGVGLMLGRRPGPIYRWIEDMYGERIAEVEQSLRATTAPAEIAPTLQVEPGSTVMEVRRIYRVAAGTVAEVSFNLYPAERFSYSMTLRRSKA